MENNEILEQNEVNMDELIQDCENNLEPVSDDTMIQPEDSGMSLGQLGAIGALTVVAGMALYEGGKWVVKKTIKGVKHIRASAKAKKAEKAAKKEATPEIVELDENGDEQ